MVPSHNTPHLPYNFVCKSDGRLNDSSKFLLRFKQAIVKAVFLHLYRRHFKKVHWCYIYLSYRQCKCTQKYHSTSLLATSAVSLVCSIWGNVKEPDKHLAVWTLLTARVPCSNVDYISRLWQPMLEKATNNKPVYMYKYRNFRGTKYSGSAILRHFVGNIFVVT